MSAESAVRLRVHSGVPIVEALGEWQPSAAEALTELIGSLAKAGHFDIVVNLQRAALSGAAALSALTRTAQTVRAHCGHIYIVGAAEQLEELIRQQTEQLFRLAASEESAIGRIKRTPVLSRGSRSTARPKD